MNVHVITHQWGDGNVRQLSEGWLLNGDTEKHRIRYSMDRGYEPAAEDFWETLPETDAAILAITSGNDQCCLAKAEEMLTKHRLWGKTILMDSHDSAREWDYEPLVEKCRVSFIGRRFLYERLLEAYPKVRWWPRCGMEQRVLRYAPPLPWRLWKDIPAVAIFRTDHRRTKHRIPWIEAARKLGAMTGELTGGDSHPAHKALCGFRHHSGYLETVSRSRIGIHLLGGNTAMGYQFWEYAALRCAILAMHPSLHPEHNIECAEWEHWGMCLVEHEDFEYFRSEDEFATKYGELDNDPERCRKMTERVAHKMVKFHSTARATDMLKVCEEVAA